MMVDAYIYIRCPQSSRPAFAFSALTFAQLGVDTFIIIAAAVFGMSGCFDCNGYQPSSWPKSSDL